MLRVVVDVNIWVSTFIKPRGHYAQMLRRALETCRIFSAEEILTEAREVSLRPRIKEKYKLTPAKVEKALAWARRISTLCSDLPDLDVIQEDPDDNVILACALKAQADYVVSYDPHLLKLKEYQGIRIIAPSDFLKRI